MNFNPVFDLILLVIIIGLIWYAGQIWLAIVNAIGDAAERDHRRAWSKRESIFTVSTPPPQRSDEAIKVQIKNRIRAGLSTAKNAEIAKTNHSWEPIHGQWETTDTPQVFRSTLISSGTLDSRLKTLDFGLTQTPTKPNDRPNPS